MKIRIITTERNADGVFDMDHTCPDTMTASLNNVFNYLMGELKAHINNGDDITIAVDIDKKGGD